MASSSQMLLDWLAGPVLSELITSQDIAPGLPKVLPPALYQPSNTEVVGPNVIWEAVQGVRTVAPITNPLSPSQRIEQQPRIRRQAAAVASRTNFVVDTELTTFIQSNIPFLQNRARQIMSQKARDFRDATENLIVSLPNAAFALDTLYVGKQGNLLPSSTGAQITISFNSLYAGVNALTKTSYWPGLASVTANLVGDWSQAAFDIPSSLRAMKQAYRFTSNYTPAHILYGKSVPAYMYGNTAMQTYMSRQPEVNKAFLSENEVPQGMLGYQWHPVDEAYYVDSNGNVQKWFADNQIVIFPEPSPMWYEYFECSLPCPKGIAVPTGSIDDFLASCPVTKGYSSYCHGHLDPVSLDCIQQWGGLPTIKNPYVKWSATVS